MKDKTTTDIHTHAHTHTHTHTHTRTHTHAFCLDNFLPLSLYFVRFIEKAYKGTIQYIYIYIYIYIYSLVPVMCNHTSCVQVHGLPQSHCHDNQDGTLFS